MHISLAKLVAYHDLELAPRRARQVALHLARCAKCRAEYDRVNCEVLVLANAEPEVPGFDAEAGLARLISAVAALEMRETGPIWTGERPVRQAGRKLQTT